MDNLEIYRMSALEVRDGIKAKKLSPVEVIDAVLQRIERINPKVNACELSGSIKRMHREGANHGFGISS